jgi:hypothetical protein
VGPIYGEISNSQASAMMRKGPLRFQMRSRNVQLV